MSVSRRWTAPRSVALPFRAQELLDHAQLRIGVLRDLARERERRAEAARRPARAGRRGPRRAPRPRRRASPRGTSRSPARSPSRCTRKCVLASSGTRPTLMKSMPNRARSEATITSHGRIIVIPMPTAAPFTAATSGFERRRSPTQSRLAGIPPEPPAVFSPGSTPVEARLEGRLHVRARAEAAAGAGHDDGARPPDRRSPPRWRAPARRPCVGVQAFSRSGRFRVMRPTASRRS